MRTWKVVLVAVVAGCLLSGVQATCGTCGESPCVCQPFTGYNIAPSAVFELLSLFTSGKLGELASCDSTCKIKLPVKVTLDLSLTFDNFNIEDVLSQSV